MKISELIAKLEEVKKEHGDLPVWEDDSEYGIIGSYPIDGKLKIMEEIKDKYGRWVYSAPKRVVLS